MASTEAGKKLPPTVAQCDVRLAQLARRLKVSEPGTEARAEIRIEIDAWLEQRLEAQG